MNATEAREQGEAEGRRLAAEAARMCSEAGRLDVLPDALETLAKGHGLHVVPALFLALPKPRGAE